MKVTILQLIKHWKNLAQPTTMEGLDVLLAVSLLDPFSECYFWFTVECFNFFNHFTWKKKCPFRHDYDGKIIF